MFAEKMELYRKSINDFLENYLDSIKNKIEQNLFESMKYSLLSDGKRIRPILTLSVYDLLNKGEKTDEIYKFAAAVEMIHTYSLIHDDLPCMDNDTTRRGKPCNHVVYGEDMALLAGDALLTQAFEIISTASCEKLNPKNILKSVNFLADSVGSSGMISGQCFDIKLNDKNYGKKELLNIYNLKTSKLITASTIIGAILANRNNNEISAIKKFGENIGIVFQLVDDILDNETYNISLFKEPNINELIQNLTDDAINSIKEINGNTDFLESFAKFLASRVI